MAAQSRGGDVYALTAGAQQAAFLPMQQSNEKNMVHLMGPGLDAIPPQRSRGGGLDVFVDAVVQTPGFYRLVAANVDTADIGLNGTRSYSSLDLWKMTDLRNEWPDAGAALEWKAGPLGPHIALIAGSAARSTCLLIEIRDSGTAGGSHAKAGFDLLVRSPRGLQRFGIRPEAPGPLQLQGEGAAGQAEGYWLEFAGGYRLELALPALGPGTDIALDGAWTSGGAAAAPSWVAIVPRWRDVEALLADASGSFGRAWLVDRDGWVLADSGRTASPAKARAGMSRWRPQASSAG